MCRCFSCYLNAFWNKKKREHLTFNVFFILLGTKLFAQNSKPFFISPVIHLLFLDIFAAVEISACWVCLFAYLLDSQWSVDLL